MAAVCFAVLVLPLGACTSTTPGRATAAAVSSSVSAASSGVPRVANPKNLKDVADPCQLITSQQLQELGASDPRPGKTESGVPKCNWKNDNLAMTLTTYGAQGLDSVYAQRNRFGNSQETTVSGYPGLRIASFSMSCGVYVGVAETQVFLADVTVRRDVRPEYKDRCVFAEKVAGMVLSNLPAVN
nr:hypothetical protein GCM10020241_60380 [Streptoalloteichus tenebrarius]